MRQYQVIVGMVLLTLGQTSAAQEVEFKHKAVSNWLAQGELHLGVDKTRLEAHKALRCIKLNNYWCLKDFGWNGGLGKDADDHTAFKTGYYAARAVVRNMRSAYSKHNRKSALAIMSAYAPSDDCVGSRAAMRADGSCIHGQNPVAEYAKAAARGITNDVNADLQLFDENNKATDALITFLQNLSTFEIGGFTVEAETIKIGICLEDDSCPHP
ncbi:MAG: hypothetical protein NWQ54_13095 [Paraglaciecola sp.]|uniref:hypothetical protein n=1 Tax=Paraglaciecola sp. TaxID=1920173 RepID=UPI0027400F96|nr:hypothetical protein [Paraglaciecola sp.]MDP5032120.1 hypothetical protein [Paraglaciecola sp.]MDP5131816.1 hypothetical protein [Paraglaciecola sp.]